VNDDTSLLGTFLRARREVVSPEQAGIPVLGMRRVAGLRREEVAMLSGISADYYLRLEQGRDRKPSPQILEAIARTLQLDEETTTYLFSLVADTPRPRRSRRVVEVVPRGIAMLVAGLTLPAFVEGRALDVLAANPLATAISPRLAPGGNRLRDVFLDPAERAMFTDWDLAARFLIAGFRQSIGTDTHDERVVELVGELSLASPRFRELWARHDVRALQSGTLTINHPQVGELTLHQEKLLIPQAGTMRLVILHPEPGSPAADALILLASTMQAAPMSSNSGGTAAR
jgi:transcriptional regulator with XRE-family HTH domain